jgi:hypothetical protein
MPERANEMGERGGVACFRDTCEYL